MSGYVGSSQLKRQKREAAGSSGAVQVLRMENDAPVVGPDAATANSKMVKLEIGTDCSRPSSGFSCHTFCMKAALYGRILFGAAAVLFGVIALMWHDADTWQNLQHILEPAFWHPHRRMSHGRSSRRVGLGCSIRGSRRSASVLLCVIYLCFSLACIPDIIAASNIYRAI